MVKAQDADVLVKGYVVDGEEGKGMENVHVFAKGSGRVTNSRRDGFFAFTVKTTDTLIFSHVGYESASVAMWKAESSKIELMIRLKKGILMLDGVDIYGDYDTPEYLIKKKNEPMYMFGKPKSLTEKPKADVPLGSTNYGPITYFSKEAREKRKVVRYYAKAVKDTTYVRTLNDPKIRADFLRMYGIERSTFDEFLRYFNRAPIIFDRNNPADIERVLHREFLRWIRQREN
ncbi:MAG TPA: hypothetical protein DDY13_12950 [Cytophagales bacterium]|jgi:hypothetical protein|nr:hypothetical protein [Cytophagales bacterium]